MRSLESELLVCPAGHVSGRDNAGLDDEMGMFLATFVYCLVTAFHSLTCFSRWISSWDWRRSDAYTIHGYPVVIDVG
jgi:hypothetical protein